jgi:hypothetical protein
VEVLDPGDAMVLGVKLTVRLPPCPEAVKVIPVVKPLETVVMVELPDPPLATKMLEGEAETVNCAEEVTVRVTVVLWVDPPVPVMVME